jgi:hypothetical protein
LAAGTAQAAAEMAGQNVALHAAGLLHPHAQYLTLTAYNAATKTASVNGLSGVVVLNAANVGAEPDLGTPAAGLVLISGANKARAWGTMPTMTGASTGAASIPGAVPVAAMGMQGAVLHGDGVWRKKRHYFMFRLLSRTEVITTVNNGFRIPVPGKLVELGLAIDSSSAGSNTWGFYAQLLKDNVPQLTTSSIPIYHNSTIGLFSYHPLMGAVIENVGANVLWKIKLPAEGFENDSVRVANLFGLSVLVVMEEL